MPIHALDTGPDIGHCMDRGNFFSFLLNGRAAVARFRLASPCASANVVRSLAASIEIGDRYYRLSNVPRRRGSRRGVEVLQLVFDRKKDARDAHAHGLTVGSMPGAF